MSTVNYYYGLLWTALLLNTALYLEGATIVDSSKTTSERIRQCESVEFPDVNDDTRKCDKVYSNKPDPPFLFGGESEMGQMMVELRCNRLNCFRLALLYDASKNLTDCKNSGEWENKEAFILSCNSTHTIKNLLPGSYCVQYTEYDLSLNGKNTCHRETMSTSTHELKPKGSTTIPEVKFDPAPQKSIPLYVFIIPVVLVLVAACLWFAYRSCRKDKFDPPSVPAIITTSPLSTAIQSAPQLNVFLVYSRDCPHHQTVVENLARFFVANNCKVAFSGWDIEEIAKNKVGWVSEKLNGNYKIILVVSKKCFEKQQAWLHNEKCLESQDTHEESLLIQAIAMIMYRIDQAFDYNKMFVVRPSYVSSDCILSNISPGRHYVIPGRIAELVCHLHNIDTKIVKLDESKLEQWNHCMMEYIALNDSIDKIMKQKICESCRQRKNYITV